MTVRYRRGLLGLSADPFTYGHLYLIATSAAKCQELLVVVANNVEKIGKYVFTLEERVAMTARGVREAGIANVRVMGWSGLLVDVYLQEACDWMYAGVRDDQDRRYENERAALNRFILPSLEKRIEQVQTIEQLQYVRSSTVKDLVRFNLDVDAFVPMFVKQALEERLLGQYRLAITGGIGVGKSHVATQLAGHVRNAKHVNVDQLLRDLYEEQTAGAQLVRDTLAERFGEGVLSADRLTVHRPALADILFRAGAEEDRAFVTALTMPHVQRKYRAAISGFKGWVILEWAQLAEMDMSAWVNNNVIVVDSPHRVEFLTQRGVTPERQALMATIQFSADEKVRHLEARVASDHSGAVIRHENRRMDRHETAQAMSDFISEINQQFFTRPLV
ncbi:MAG: hypothetical protein RLZZ324_699 [Candidatus Parcubacteria bacterium]|jgi:pantetheine-phosphate adenylyltransferase